MPRQYLQQLTEETAPVITDQIPITDSGTQRLRRMQLSTLRKLLAPFNVKDFRATGDGVTDDTAFIQAAIDAAKIASANIRSGAEVRVPVGRYMISSPLVLPRNGATPDDVVRLVGDSMYTCIIEGTSAFPPNRGLIEWEPTTSRVWHGRIANLTFRCPPGVANVRAIYHKTNASLSSILDVMNEWFQCDFENLYFEGSNNDVETFIDLEVGNRYAVMRNLFGDPWRGGVSVPTYDTLLLRTPTQYNGTDAALGEDSIGIGICTLENLFGMIRQGGWCRTFQGRMYATSWTGAFNNGPLAGRSTGGIGYEFRNSFACDLRNLSSEGGGGEVQYRFCKCRDIRGGVIGVATGDASETAWAASTAYGVGARVIPTLLSNPVTPAPRNKVYTCTVPGTSAVSEPTWTASGTVTDGGVTWSTSDGPAAANGIEFQQCENMVFGPHYANPSSPPASYRLTKAVKIDADCRDVKLRDWTLRVISTGAPSTDASSEIENLAAASARNVVSGEVVQSLGDVRFQYIIGSQVFVGGTAGSVMFVGANGIFAQDNASLFWDDANNCFTVANAEAVNDNFAAVQIVKAGTDGTLGPLLLSTRIYPSASGANRAVSLLVSDNGGLRRLDIDALSMRVNGPLTIVPGASVTPAANGHVVIEATDNTTLTFKLKGSDGTVRSGTVTLS